jgi:hypothetical protein
VSGNQTENAEKSTVTGCSEAVSHFETIAGPQPIGASLKAAFNTICAEIHRATGVKFRPSRVEDIWRGEARRIEFWEMDAIRAAAKARKRKAEEASLDDEIAALRERLERIEASYAVASASLAGAPGREVRKPLGGVRHLGSGR